MAFSRLLQDASVTKLATAYYNHPFNTALLDGVLPSHTFHSFLEQDLLYLQDFSTAFSNISKRLQLTHANHAQQFQQFNDETVGYERYIHENYLAGEKTNLSVRKKNPAIAQYTKHLLTISQEGQIDEAIASLLPCFWLYNQLGKKVGAVKSDHPYYAWIKTYAAPEFNLSTEAIIHIFDDVTNDIKDSDKQQRINAAFRKSAFYELSFLQSVYGKPVEDFASLEKLDKAFRLYQLQFGTRKPVHTRSVMFNNWGNTLASWMGKKVNQEDVTQGRKIIAEARTALQAHPSDKNVIETAVDKLQQLHAKIIKNTNTGETTRNIVAALNDYGYVLTPKGSPHLFARNAMVWTRRATPLKSTDLANKDRATHKTKKANIK